ncbi:MAG: hypothetical protein KME46_33535 [Brasilonema angustatum HA4187-MV1]|jgi:hypothetical protein|nr:hypothetical protein [Brasilonema angustatum HA4187-MV1]
MQDALTAATIAIPALFATLMLLDFIDGLRKLAIASQEEKSPAVQIIETPIDWELPHKSLVVDPWLSAPRDTPCIENLLHTPLYQWSSLPMLPPAKELVAVLPGKAKKTRNAAPAATPTTKRRSRKAA